MRDKAIFNWSGGKDTALCLYKILHNVDPCGENGEFHTFAFDGPVFKKPIHFEKGEVVYKKYKHPQQKGNSTYGSDSNNEVSADSPFNNGFWYCDLFL